MKLGSATKGKTAVERVLRQSGGREMSPFARDCTAWRRAWCGSWKLRPLLIVLLLLWFCPRPGWSGGSSLPRRLVLALDGVSYRHMQALQEGILVEDDRGQRVCRRAFDEGFFPVSRLISTFPSATDVAWTEIFGNRPLPGYQRTYYSHQANTTVVVNGVSSSMEFERQMTWRMEGGFGHAMSYLFPERVYRCEVRDLVRNFLSATGSGETYYGYICVTDCAQHMWCDIFAMLCALDEELDRLRATYRAREGRELQILILSDHGNNQAGPGQRVMVRNYLRQAGYRIATSISDARDVVLPTVGIESWVEVHNWPAETGRLLELLAGLPGADVLTARAPEDQNRFLVMNSRCERAIIQWNRAQNAFRYEAEAGDPIGYLPARDVLKRAGQLDPAGFAPADAWMEVTLTNHYPLALERIAQAHSTATLNPANILISLKNGYVHAGSLVKKGSELVKCGGTHGGLDELNSNGILLSNFAPTRDTSASRVAAEFGGFQGLREYRATEEGAEWVAARAQALVRVPRGPLDGSCGTLPDGPCLRIWSPRLVQAPAHTELDVGLRRLSPFPAAKIRRGEGEDAEEERVTLGQLSVPGLGAWERVYSLPPAFRLAPYSEYNLVGRLHAGPQSTPIVRLQFRTDAQGMPAADYPAAAAQPGAPTLPGSRFTYTPPATSKNSGTAGGRPRVVFGGRRSE